MADYELYYWSVPFRGQFVRAVLAYASKIWTEPGDASITRLKDGPVADMPVPFMGPPLLVDNTTGAAIAQMPAIVFYLGETLNLMPSDPALHALTMKIVCDANDVLDELTLDGGQLMWTPERWQDFVPRLKKWMGFWEETGRRHGLDSDGGFLLGGTEPGIADVVSATLWSTIADRFPAVGAILDETAPVTATLVNRVAALPTLARLADIAKQDYGDTWSGGQIEASLRTVLDS